ncbi:MAG: SDR family oxidoreductase [Pseudomonadota bacterium]
MDLGLHNKVAVIGASSQGLGKACALAMAREGAHVVICGRTDDILTAAHDEIEEAGPGECIAVQADLADPHGQRAVIDSTIAEFGHADILVTNTGGPPPGIFEHHDPAAWDAAYRLLLASAVGMINGVLPGMKKNRWGRIIGITSQAVKQPVDNLILSNTMRAGVTGLLRSLANELGPDGITVNSVLPGYHDTDRLKALLGGEENYGAVTGDIPLGRVGDPAEFADMVTFLASDRASYVTGQAIAVDGGWINGLI